MNSAKIRKRLKENKRADGGQLIANRQKVKDCEALSIELDERGPKTETKGERIKEERTRPRETEGKAEGEKTANIVEIITFTLLNEEFAFRVSHIEEILRSQWITMVPKMPAYVLGISSLRGKIIPVIDLKLLLALKGGPYDINSKGKILIVKGPNGPLGAAVDRVTSVARLSESEILPPPSHLTERELRFIEGVAIIDKRFISILRVEEVAAISVNKK